MKKLKAAGFFVLLATAASAAEPFFVGVNYPWHDYGADFGTSAWGHKGVSDAATRAEVAADFAGLKADGVKVVRWFVFCDGRSAPSFDAQGFVTGLAPSFYADFDAALAIARENDIRLIPVLLDFHLADKAALVKGVQTGGRSSLIADPERTKSFVEKAVKPLVARYGSEKTILAWEVINEPEWAMNILFGGRMAEPVSAAQMQTFVSNVAAAIHAGATQGVTVGSASRRFLHYWRAVGLDLYEFHHYDSEELVTPLDKPYSQLGLDKPCLLGEFPTKNSKRSASQYLDIALKDGYAGALAWSLRATDESTGFKDEAKEFQAWTRAHGAK